MSLFLAGRRVRPLGVCQQWTDPLVSNKHINYYLLSHRNSPYPAKTLHYMKSDYIVVIQVYANKSSCFGVMYMSIGMCVYIYMYMYILA